MNTKLNYPIFLCTAFVIMLFACNDDHDFGTKDLPDYVQSFVLQYFPESEISDAVISRENPAYYGTQYLVTLDDDTKILYGSQGDYRIVAPNGVQEMTKTLISQKFLNELSARNPQGKITHIQTQFESDLLIGMHDGKRYRLTKGMDGVTTLLADLVTSVAEIPASILTFIDKYNLRDILDDSNFMLVNENGRTYYRFYYYGTYYSLVFDEAGRWLQVRSGDITHGIQNDIAAGEVPEKVLEALKSINGSLAWLRSISCYDNGIYGFEYTRNSFLITEEGEFLGNDETAETFMKRYYPSDVWLEKQYQPLIYSPYEYFYSHTYLSESKNITVTFDDAREWRSITSANPVTVSRIPLADEFIENEIPIKIQEYLQENYPQLKIYQVMRNEQGRYDINIYSSTHLAFDVDGNLLEKAY